MSENTQIEITVIDTLRAVDAQDWDACACPEAASDTRIAASPISRIWPSRLCPAMVSSSDRPTRSNSVMPSSASMAATCRPRVGCVRPRACAAAVKDPDFVARASEKFGVDIHPAARVGRGIMIDHAHSIVIGETAVVGNDVSMLHSVTLGGTGKEEEDRHPKIGDGVLIGAGASVLGNDTDGDGDSLSVSAVNGQAGAVGAQTTLASARC